MARLLSHIASLALSLLLFVALPLAATGHLIPQESSNADLVSSATQMLDAPSGKFTLLLNRELHSDDVVRERWKAFLTGEQTELIMEDVSCVVLNGDSAALELAQSLQSRLAENQMKVRIEEAQLALSKADCGRFDLLVLTDEAARHYNTESLENQAFVEVIRR